VPPGGDQDDSACPALAQERRGTRRVGVGAGGIGFNNEGGAGYLVLLLETLEFRIGLSESCQEDLGGVALGVEFGDLGESRGTVAARDQDDVRFFGGLRDFEVAGDRERVCIHPPDRESGDQNQGCDKSEQEAFPAFHHGDSVTYPLDRIDRIYRMNGECLGVWRLET